MLFQVVNFQDKVYWLPFSNYVTNFRFGLYLFTLHYRLVNFVLIVNFELTVQKLIRLEEPKHF
jgi:hypothetical protein